MMSEEPDTLEDRIDRLETVIEEQQETIERQNERLEELDSEDSTTAEDDGITVSRRGALAAGGVLGLLGLGAGTAGANPTGSVGTPSSPLETLYTAELDGPLTSDMVNTLAGDGLEITNNALQVNAGDSLSISDDGSLNAETEWFRDTYIIRPADDGVHTVDLDGRRIVDRAATRAIYHSDDGLNSDALDIDWVSIAGNEVSLGGNTSIQHERLLNLAYDNHHGPGDGLAWNSDTSNYDITPADFAGNGLGVDAENNLEVTSSGDAAWVEGTDTLEPANPGNYSSIDVKANDVIDSFSGSTIWNSTDSHVPAAAIQSGSIGVDQLDMGMSPTWTAAHTWSMGGVSDLKLDDSGVTFSSAENITFDVRNSDTGGVDIQEDGTPVVTQTRSLTGGAGIQSIGDLSADRTIALADNGVTSAQITRDAVSSTELADQSYIDWDDGSRQTTGGPVAKGTIQTGDGVASADNTVGVSSVNMIDQMTVQVNISLPFSNASEIIAFAQGRGNLHESLRCQPDPENNAVVIETASGFGIETFQFVALSLPPVA